MTSFPLNSGDKNVPFLLVMFSGNYFILLVSDNWIKCIFLTGPAKTSVAAFRLGYMVDFFLCAKEK